MLLEQRRWPACWIQSPAMRDHPHGWLLTFLFHISLLLPQLTTRFKSRTVAFQHCKSACIPSPSRFPHSLASHSQSRAWPRLFLFILTLFSNLCLSLFLRIPVTKTTSRLPFLLSSFRFAFFSSPFFRLEPFDPVDRALDQGVIHNCSALV